MAIDWNALWAPQQPLIAIVIRGSIMYVALFAVLRFVVRRQVGALGITDVLLVVLIADAAQNAMAGDSKSISEGLVLCGTLVAWNYLFDWLAFRFAFARRLLEPPALEIIRDGRVEHRHMKQEMITQEELLSHLRLQGVEKPSNVRMACIEPDGHISVIKKPH